MIKNAPVVWVEWSIAVFLFVQIWKHAVLEVLSGIPGLILAWSSMDNGRHQIKLNNLSSAEDHQEWL